MMLEWFFAFFFNLTNALEMKGELGVDVLKDAANGNEALGQIVNLHNYYNAWTVMIKIFEAEKLKCSFKMFFVFVQIFDFFLSNRFLGASKHFVHVGHRKFGGGTARLGINLNN